MADMDAIKRAQAIVLPLDLFEDADRARIARTLSRYAEGLRHRNALRQVQDQAASASVEDEVERAKKLVSGMRLLSDHDATLKGESLKALRATVETPWHLLLNSDAALEGCSKLLGIPACELALWIARELDPPNSGVFLRLADTLKLKRENSESAGELAAMKEKKTADSRAAALAKHEKSGKGDAKAEIARIWESGKYATKIDCAEQECDYLGISLETARKALRGVPDPSLEVWVGRKQRRRPT